MLQDVRYGLRVLRRRPGFTAAAVLTLALGLGANTAIFSVVNAVLLRPLPYAQPERLAVLWTDDPKHDAHEEGTSYPNFEEWRSQSRAFAEMAVCTRGNPVALGGADGPERVEAEAVSANLFKLLGATPLLGRTFTEEDEARRASVVVISHALWQRRFGGAADVVGKTVEVNGAGAEVVGVMPKGFFFPAEGTQLWRPVTSFERWDKVKDYRFNDWWRVVGRLRPGATFEEARAEMRAVGARLEQSYPVTDAGFAGYGVNVVPVSEQVAGPRLRLALWSLLGAVFFVLLIGCANLANLTLARHAARRRELAIRTALGASGQRLLRQMLTESVVLASAGGALGLALAAGAVKALVAFAPPDIPRLEEVGLDANVLGFACGLTLLASLLFGSLPAWRFSRTDPNDSLKEGGRGLDGSASGRRTRGLLVAAEVALASVLLVCAGLLTRSLLEVRSVPAGLDAQGVLTLKVGLPQSTPRARVWPFYQKALEGIAALPGVESAAAASHVFLESNPDWVVTVEGRAAELPGDGRQPLTGDYVSADYFKTLRVPLIEGRVFSEQDAPGSPPAAVVNETMARRFFGEGDAVGRRFKFGGPESKSPPVTVVGVVADVRNRGPEARPVAQFFVPVAQESDTAALLLVRASGDPLALVPAVRERIHAADGQATVFGVETLEERLGEFSARRGFQTRLLSLFSFLALLLAAVGVYGVTSYAVAQQTREIGIRVALGARRRSILALVLRQGMGHVLLGLAAGALLSLWVTPVLSGLLYGVGAADPLTFTGVGLLLTLTALLACLVPARKAMKVDPMVALRYE